MPSSASAMASLTWPTARRTPLPPKRSSPSRSSAASNCPVDAPDGTMARPVAPDARNTSTSTVGFPRESKTSRAATCSMEDMTYLWLLLQVWRMVLLGRPPSLAPWAVPAPPGKPDTQRGRPNGRRRLRLMAIRVAAGTADLICDYADGFVVEVAGASDLDAATRALARARPDIEALSPVPATDPEGPVVSLPVLGPEGPLIRVARLEVNDDLLSSIPDLVANRLEEAGVTDALVRSPEPGGALDRLDGCPNAVV